MLNAVLKAKSFDKVNNHDRHDRNRKPEVCHYKRNIFMRNSKIKFTTETGNAPKGGLAQPQEINSQNMTIHDPSVCVASVVFQVHS